MRQRQIIFFKETNVGTFNDGRRRLYVTFRDKTGNEYEWTPRWEEEVIKLLDEASQVEAINSPNSRYIESFAEIAKRVFERLPPTEIQLRIAFLTEIRNNKLIVADPGFIENYDIYQRIPRLETKSELPVAFRITQEITDFMGDHVVLWIVNGIVVKLSKASWPLSEAKSYP